MQILYSLFIHCFTLFLKIAAIFNPKARLWVLGRKNFFEELKRKMPAEHAPLTWFHCASLGEFEQGRPLIEKLKAEEPDIKIVLTFFSPSGFEIRKNYKGADWVFYLPADTPANAQMWVDYIKPQKAIFIKYEFWFNYMQVLSSKAIPTYFVAVNIRPDHYFLKWYGSWALSRMKKVTHFFVQNETSLDLLQMAGISSCSVAGDTRFDRVIEIANENKSYPLIEQFCGAQKILVAGSTWPEDEKLLAQLELNEIKLIVAPHEIQDTKLSMLEHAFKKHKVIRFSKITNSDLSEFKVLLIDNIGMLSALYKYATIAYVGGGFGKGIHNILEAAVFGKPVLFGPNYQKFEEAKQLLKRGGATSINTQDELQNTILELLSDQKKYREQSLTSQNFVHDNAGAINLIYSKIK